MRHFIKKIVNLVITQQFSSLKIGGITIEIRKTKLYTVVFAKCSLVIHNNTVPIIIVFVPFSYPMQWDTCKWFPSKLIWCQRWRLRTNLTFHWQSKTLQRRSEPCSGPNSDTDREHFIQEKVIYLLERMYWNYHLIGK